MNEHEQHLQAASHAAATAGTARYLPHVDGLRAIAVSLVVAYHVGVPGLTGGYIGVDVFFVISGYLIIGQIADRITRGGFSLGDFWLRRVYRILPTYLLVLLVSTVLIAPHIPTAVGVQDFGRQVLWSALMLVNHYFLALQGYFDTAAEGKPLLHLWSLAVEEQFYVFAPLIALALWKVTGGWAIGSSGGRLTLLFCALIFGGSLLGCIALTGIGDDRNYAFYLMPLRAWEFLAGGAVPILLRLAPRLPDRLVSALPVAGLALILVPAVAFDAASAFPSWRAALPVAGSCLLILAGLLNSGHAVTRVLASVPMVAVGLISYALYLWHWPLLYLGRQLQAGASSFWQDLLFGAAIPAVAAALTYLLLERPVRRWRQSASPRAVLVPASGLVVACALSAGIGISLPRMIEPPTIIATVRPADGVDKTPASDPCDIGKHGDLTGCTQGQPFGLVMGDSTARFLHTAVLDVASTNGTRVAMLAMGGCAPFFDTIKTNKGPKRHEKCAEQQTNARTALTGNPMEFAILQAFWIGQSANLGYPEDGGTVAPDQEEIFVRKLDATIGELQASGAKRILILGPTPIFPHRADECLARVAARQVDPQHCNVPVTRFLERARPADRLLRAAAESDPAVRYSDISGIFCDEVDCSPAADGVPMFYDRLHTLRAGSDRILGSIAEDVDWVVGAR